MKLFNHNYNNFLSNIYKLIISTCSIKQIYSSFILIILLDVSFNVIQTLNISLTLLQQPKNNIINMSISCGKDIRKMFYIKLHKNHSLSSSPICICRGHDLKFNKNDEINHHPNNYDGIEKLYLLAHCKLPLIPFQQLFFTFYQLPNLNIETKGIKELDISENGITHLNDKPFLHLKKLKKLILRNNSIFQIQPGAFEGLLSLTKLDLSNNLLNQVNRDLFTHLPKLQRLNLGGNLIKTISDNTFHALPNLKWIFITVDVCDCKIRNVMEWFIRNDIKIANMSICKSPHPLAPSQLKNLKKKDFHCNWPLELDEFHLEPPSNQIIFAGDPLSFRCNVQQLLQLFIPNYLNSYEIAITNYLSQIGEQTFFPLMATELETFTFMRKSLRRLILQNLNDIIKIEWNFDGLQIINSSKSIIISTQSIVKYEDPSLTFINSSAPRAKSLTAQFKIEINSVITFNTSNLTRKDILGNSKDKLAIDDFGKGDDASGEWTCKAFFNSQYANLLESIGIIFQIYQERDIKNKTLKSQQIQNISKKNISNIYENLLEDGALQIFKINKLELTSKRFVVVWKNISKWIKIDILSNHTNYCQESITQNVKGTFIWPLSLRNTLIYVSCPIIHNTNLTNISNEMPFQASRFCKWDGTWEDYLNTSLCRYVNIITQDLSEFEKLNYVDWKECLEGIGKLFQYLPHILQPNSFVSSNNSNNLESLTNYENEAQQHSIELNLIFMVKILEKIIEYIILSKSEKAAFYVLSLIDRIIDFPFKILQNAQLQNNTSNRLVIMIDKLTKIFYWREATIKSNNFAYINIRTKEKYSDRITCLFYHHTKPNLNGIIDIKCNSLPSRLNQRALLSEKNVKAIVQLSSHAMENKEEDEDNCNNKMLPKISMQNIKLSAFNWIYYSESSSGIHPQTILHDNSSNCIQSNEQRISITFYSNLKLFKHLKIKHQKMDGKSDFNEINENNEFLPTLTSPIININTGMSKRRTIIYLKCIGPSLFDNVVQWDSGKNEFLNEWILTNGDGCRIIDYIGSFCKILCTTKSIPNTGIMQDATLLMYKRAYPSSSSHNNRLPVNPYFEMLVWDDATTNHHNPTGVASYDNSKLNYEKLIGYNKGNSIGTTKTYFIRITTTTPQSFSSKNHLFQLPWYMTMGGGILCLTLFILTILYIIFNRIIVMSRNLKHCLINHWSCSALLIFIYLFGLRFLVYATNKPSFNHSNLSSIGNTKYNSLFGLCEGLAILMHFLSLCTLIWVTLITRCIFLNFSTAVTKGETNNLMKKGDLKYKYSCRDNYFHKHRRILSYEDDDESNQLHRQEYLTKKQLPLFAARNINNEIVDPITNNIQGGTNGKYHWNNHKGKNKIGLIENQDYQISDDYIYSNCHNILNYQTSKNNNLSSLNNSSTLSSWLTNLNYIDLWKERDKCFKSRTLSNSSIADHYFMGYGLSFLICCATASWDLENYQKKEEICFINWEAGTWTFYGPCVLLIILNVYYITKVIYLYCNILLLHSHVQSNWLFNKRRPQNVANKNSGFCGEESFLLEKDVVMRTPSNNVKILTPINSTYSHNFNPQFYFRQQMPFHTKHNLFYRPKNNENEIVSRGNHLNSNNVDQCIKGRTKREIERNRLESTSDGKFVGRRLNNLVPCEYKRQGHELVKGCDKDNRYDDNNLLPRYNYNKNKFYKASKDIHKKRGESKKIRVNRNKINEIRQCLITNNFTDGCSNINKLNNLHWIERSESLRKLVTDVAPKYYPSNINNNKKPSLKQFQHINNNNWSTSFYNSWIDDAEEDWFNLSTTVTSHEVEAPNNKTKSLIHSTGGGGGGDIKSTINNIKFQSSYLVALIILWLAAGAYITSSSTNSNNIISNEIVQLVHSIITTNNNNQILATFGGNTHFNKYNILLDVERSRGLAQKIQLVILSSPTANKKNLHYQKRVLLLQQNENIKNNNYHDAFDQLLHSIGDGVNEILLSITFGSGGNHYKEEDYDNLNNLRDFELDKKDLLELQPYHVKYYLDYYAGRYLIQKGHLNQMNQHSSRLNILGKSTGNNNINIWQSSSENVLASYIFLIVSTILTITLALYHGISRTDLMSAIFLKNSIEDVSSMRDETFDSFCQSTNKEHEYLLNRQNLLLIEANKKKDEENIKSLPSAKMINNGFDERKKRLTKSLSCLFNGSNKNGAINRINNKLLPLNKTNTSYKYSSNHKLNSQRSLNFTPNHIPNKNYNRELNKKPLYQQYPDKNIILHHLHQKMCSANQNKYKSKSTNLIPLLQLNHNQKSINNRMKDKQLLNEYQNQLSININYQSPFSEADCINNKPGSF